MFLRVHDRVPREKRRRRHCRRSRPGKSSLESSPRTGRFVTVLEFVSKQNNRDHWSGDNLRFHDSLALRRWDEFQMMRFTIALFMQNVRDAQYSHRTHFVRLSVPLVPGKPCSKKSNSLRAKDAPKQASAKRRIEFNKKLDDLRPLEVPAGTGLTVLETRSRREAPRKAHRETHKAVRKVQKRVEFLFVVFSLGPYAARQFPS